MGEAGLWIYPLRPRILGNERVYGSESKKISGPEETKVFHTHGVPLQALRPFPCGVPKVRHLPDLLPQLGQPRHDPRREKGELVA